MTYRVVQWTTGRSGRKLSAASSLIQSSTSWVATRSAPKRSAATSASSAVFDPIGVAATDDVEALLELAPDCVSYMPYRPDFDHVVRILESGVDIVTTLYMLSGWGNGDDVHDRIVAAAERAAPRCSPAASTRRHEQRGHGAQRDVRARGLHLAARVARAQRLREREDVPGDGLRRRRRRPGRRRAVRVDERIVQGLRPHDGARDGRRARRGALRRRVRRRRSHAGLRVHDDRRRSGSRGSRASSPAWSTVWPASGAALPGRWGAR